MLTKVDKALAALIVSGVSQIALHFGLEVSPEMAAGATSLLTMFFVWLVPNKVEV